MANLITVRHENAWEGWGNPGTTRAVIENTPSGAPSTAEKKVVHVTPQAGGNGGALDYPRADLVTEQKELYVGMLFYLDNNIQGGNANSDWGPNLFIPAIFQGWSAGLYPFFSAHLVGSGDNSTFSLGLRSTNRYIDGWGTGNEPQTDLTIPGIPYRTWVKLDFHVVIGAKSFFRTHFNGSDMFKWEINLDAKVDCVGAGSASGFTAVRPGDPDLRFRTLWQPDSCAQYNYYMDNLVVNSVDGSRDISYPCSSPVPGQGFLGDSEVGSISIAPEKLPHVITREDVGGNITLQKKLNDNFESIERQLLALDPDLGDSENPWR